MGGHQKRKAAGRVRHKKHGRLEYEQNGGAEHEQDGGERIHSSSARAARREVAESCHQSGADGGA